LSIAIIGADSNIGGALERTLRTDGEAVAGTTRRKRNALHGRLHLDLADHSEKWSLPQTVNSAIICAGATKIDECQREPDGTANINVRAVCKLIMTLIERGAFVIYLSSSQVFNGDKPYSLPDDTVSPITEYGRQRAEVEKFLKSWPDQTTIIRMTKVLGRQNTLFDEWAKKLKSGQPIHPFADLRFSPVPLSFAVHAVRLVAERHLTGVLHVSGPRDISYADAALLGARASGCDQALVMPVEGKTKVSYPVPKNTVLNIDRLKFELKLSPPDVEQVIVTAFRDPASLETKW